MQREFYRSARGPTPSDEDVWRLLFDRKSGSLCVRHEWHSERYSGTDDFELAEFVTEQGAAQAALLYLLFGEATVDPWTAARPAAVRQ